MLYDIEPDTSVTGGTWYSNQDFEVEFVDVLNQQCFRFLDERVRCILNFKKNFFVVEKLEINHFILHRSEIHFWWLNFNTTTLEQRIEANSKSKNPLERIQLSYANSDEIWSFIKNLGISKVDLSKPDIESILQTLIYDGKIECHIKGGDGSTKLYRALVNNLGTLNIGLLKSPCGGCPLTKDCNEGYIISPTTCVYLKDWFDF